MQINDEGIILKKKKYRESSLIISFFSLNHGLNSGLVKGVLKKDFGTYEIGNKVYNFPTANLNVKHNLPCGIYSTESNYGNATCLIPNSNKI